MKEKGFAPIIIIVIIVIITTGIISSKYFFSKLPNNLLTTNTSSTINNKSKSIVLSSTPSQLPIPIVPKTSASAITTPPSSMDGINTHTEFYSHIGADQNMITLGPKVDRYSIKTPYLGKFGFEFELDTHAPLLAPMDMTFTGFQNNSIEYKIENGQRVAPVNDLMMSFESDSPDWPGVVIVLYHVYTSPLVPGHYQNPNCGDIEIGSNKFQSEGHIFFAYDDYTVSPKNNAESCRALIGHKVKRGELIGYAGNVGENSFASFCFKVPDKSINPTVKSGNRNLHWVQPASFFYWKSYGPNVDFPSGVLAYPFEVDGYQLPAEQRNVNFKYSPKK